MAFSSTEALEFLARAHASQRLAHAYLITGPASSGKRRLASDLFALINGLPGDGVSLKHPDLHTVEPESKSRIISIDQMRELERELQMSPTSARRKTGVVIDADRMTQAASNSFLKTLEEPPPQSLLLLLSANPAQLLDTILSRCVILQLKSAGRAGPTDCQRRLLDALAAFFKNGKSGTGEIFNLARDFTLLLSEIKSTISGANEAVLKQEQTHYKQTTDSAKWLEDREDYYKALSESEYIRQRFGLVDTLMQWWGDALRHQQGGVSPDLPGYAGPIAEVAARYPAGDILNRISQVEELRENFDRNVHEALAVEVAFLRVFAAVDAGG